MVNSVSSQPSHDQLREAFQAGFDSIDDGDGFYFGFHASLITQGFGLREDILCTCSDTGAHGHLPECRWVKS